MSEPKKDGTDLMMALLTGLSGTRASKAWNESQQIKAESFLTLAEHWINQTAEENARLKAEVERLTKAGDAMAFIMAHQKDSEFDGFVEDWNAAKEGKPRA
jgi:hypothetical protein